MSDIYNTESVLQNPLDLAENSNENEKPNLQFFQPNHVLESFLIETKTIESLKENL